MKLKHAAVLITVALLAACGGGKQEGDVRFLGSMPLTAKEKDTRSVQVFCPNCHEPTEVDRARCENKKCKVDMHWSAEYRCPSCQGSGVCASCSVLEQANGDCYNCKGSGILIFQGATVDCPNCKGSKKCPICKGNMKCTDCGGNKTLAKDVIKSRSAKSDGLPESDARPPVEKKDESKKEEPKKEGAAPPAEEKK